MASTRDGNEAWADLVGRTSRCDDREDRFRPVSETVGPTIFPQQRPGDAGKWENRVADEEWVDYPDGRRVLLDTVKTPWLDSEGEVLGVLGI